MKLLRTVLYPVICFGLAWGAAHLVKLMASVGDKALARVSVPAAQPAPKAQRADRLAKLSADFKVAKPGEWSALWHAFAAQATIAELQDAARQPGVMFPKLAEEELTLRAGALADGPINVAALAARDPDAAFALAKRSGETATQSTVLRVIAWSDPAKALSLARRLPAGRPLSVNEGYAIGRSSSPDTPLGAAYSAWARRDPLAAIAAAEKEGRRFRGDAVGQVVRMWAYRDGAAALRYLAESVMTRQELSMALRMDYILRAAFFSNPEGSAKVLREHPSLLEGSESGSPLLLCRWYLADPQGAVAYLHTSESEDMAMSLIGYVTQQNPAEALQLMRAFPKAGYPDHARGLALIAESSPSAALAVADELGLRAKVDAELRLAEIKARPAEACDRWLAAVQKHGAKQSLTALGWTSEQALTLAAFASHAFPDKARALAAAVPASVLMPEKRYIGSEQAALKFWPDLQPETKSDPAAATAIPPDPKPPLPFAANPAAAAEGLLTGVVSEADAAKAVNCWAPHDFTAAKAWVARLPEGPARKAADLALAKEQALHDPTAVLSAATAGRFDAPSELWQQCIRSIALAGGDWKTWAANAPAGALDDQRFTNRSLTVSFEDDVNILAAIRAYSSR